MINNDSAVLVTGATGSFGQAFIKHILSLYPRIRRLVVFSRDELKQYQMANIIRTDEFPGLRYFIGDIRDYERLKQALEGIEIVVHAAALKQVPVAEYNPFEFIKTNVLGAENLLRASLATGVRKIVALSTDKACAPINLYGATKLCADKLFVAGNNIKGARDLSISIVRYGNVLGSRGSVIPFFLSLRDSGTLPITDLNMTRFSINLQQGIDMVLWAAGSAVGGEIFIPKIPSYRIVDVAEAVAPGAKLVCVGVRPGEKIHEEMITSSDAIDTYDLGKYYAILSQSCSGLRSHYLKEARAKPVEPGFSYTSLTNEKFLTVGDIRGLIKQHIDPNFPLA